MKKLIFTIIALISFQAALFSQEELKGYVVGHCVTFKNDTVFGFIKESSLAESCSKIGFKEDSLSKLTVLTPETVKSYKKGNQTFVTRRIGNSDASPLLFVIPIIEGELSLYSRWVYTTATTKSSLNPISLQKEVKHLQLYRKSIISLNNKKFNRQVSKLVSDNKELSLKVLVGDLTDINTIVNEYNLWHKNGRADNLTKKELKKVKGQIKLLTDSKFSVNFSMGLTRNILRLETGLNESVSVEEAFSPDVSFGFQYSISDAFKIGIGARYWETQINPSYKISKLGLMDDTHVFQVKEESRLQNTSVYFHFFYERRRVFFGGGCNIGVANKYKSTIEYYLNDSELVYSEEDTCSLLSSSFYYQSHFDVTFGLKFNTKTSFSFRPFTKISIPFTSLYATKSNSYSNKLMHAYPVTIGVIVEFGLVD